MKICRENEVLVENVPVSFCPQQIPHQPDLASNPGRSGMKPVANHLSYGTSTTVLRDTQVWQGPILKFHSGSQLM
jgi:hypothetical protein